MASGIEDTLPPLRLIRAAPLTCSEVSGPLRPRPNPPLPPRPAYADYLERQNAIDRRTDDPTIPYSDYLRSLPSRPKPPAPCDPSACHDSRRDDASARGAPALGLKLADVPPPQVTRREIEVRTTYRVVVPLTSGRLIDVVS